MRGSVVRVQGGVLAGAARYLVAQRMVGLPGGVAPSRRVGGRGGGGGVSFAARQPRLSCRVEYARVTSSRTTGVTDQDLHQSEAWLANRWPLMGVMARLTLLACHCRPVVAVMARRSILPGHGVVPGCARYANRLEGLVRLAQKLVGVVCCGMWVIVVVTCVIVNAIHLPQL
jgi:hypothetical protein